jgi:hypothetical protein
MKPITVEINLLYVSHVSKLKDALYFKENALVTDVIHLVEIQQNVDYTVFCNEHSCVYFKSTQILKDLYIIKL